MSNQAPVGPPCMLDRIARIVAKNGLETEKRIKEFSGDDPKRLPFLWSRDPNHELYKRKIAEYIKCPPPPLPLEPAQRVALPESGFTGRYENSYMFRVSIPEGMTCKEIGIVKFTAQFVARYGTDFMSVLGDNIGTELEFVKKRDTRYTFFTQLLVDYENLIMPYRTQPWKSDTALMEAVVEGFVTAFDAFKKRQEEEEEENEVVHKVQTDRSDFVVSTDEYFADIENKDLPPPQHSINQMFDPRHSTGMVQPLPLHEEPEPKRPKFVKSGLVPEEEFLAQHPGSSTITVCATTGEVIQITVQSLSENVASLKEKIAGEMAIPANQHKLMGKTGFLKDDMSLAHYNLGAGEMLTLNW